MKLRDLSPRMPPHPQRRPNRTPRQKAISPSPSTPSSSRSSLRPAATTAATASSRELVAEMHHTDRLIQMQTTTSRIRVTTGNEWRDIMIHVKDFPHEEEHHLHLSFFRSFVRLYSLASRMDIHGLDPRASDNTISFSLCIHTPFRSRGSSGKVSPHFSYNEKRCYNILPCDSTVDPRLQTPDFFFFLFSRDRQTVRVREQAESERMFFFFSVFERTTRFVFFTIDGQMSSRRSFCTPSPHT